jgi:hypothetical protein
LYPHAVSANEVLLVGESGFGLARLAYVDELQVGNIPLRLEESRDVDSRTLLNGMRVFGEGT